MTQVVNAYLAWSFEHVTVELIESRGDPGDHLTALRRFISARRRIRTISASPHPAVIVVHLSERGSFVREGSLATYAARLGLPVIAHLHGSEFAAFDRAHPKLVGSVLKASSRVITLSDESTAISARYVGADRVSLVPNAVPDGSGGPKTRSVVFGGVVSVRKGVDVLQDAWRTITDDYPDWELTVAGPLREEHIVDVDLPRARFVGSVAHDRLLELLEDAAVAVLPSRDEAMPMFILEAMSRRACVVSTTVGSIPALLADDCGVLIPPADAVSLAAALRRVLTDDDERSAIAERGHERFRRDYAADSVFPRVERLWLDVLSTAAPLAPTTR